MNIVYLAPVKSQARFHKRISMLRNDNNSLKYLYFHRDYYQGKEIPYESECLGVIEHGNYLKRIMKLTQAIPKLKKEIKFTDCFYVFSIDLLLLLIISSFFKKRNKIIYEVGDLGVRTTGGIFAYIIRILENWLLKYVDTVVLTSKEYENVYYSKLNNYNPSNFLIIENKIDKFTYPDVAIKTDFSNVENRLTIGYFGVLRFRSSMDLLLRIAEIGDSEVEIILAGKLHGTENYIEKIKKFDNIKFLGSYVSPDDLPYLYSKIDISWVALNSINSRYMRTNRFYESCYYKKPLITHVNSLDGYMSKKYDIGININMENLQESVDQVLGITKDDISLWSSHIHNVPEWVYIYQNESKVLLERIKSD